MTLSLPAHLASPIDNAKAHEVVWWRVSPLFEAMRLVADASYLYVISEKGGPIKIGKATDPIHRLRQMQCGNPRRLRIEWVLVGDRPMEKLVHELWEEFAIYSANKVGKPGAAPGTEWFRNEIRDTLFPIMDTAAQEQAKYIDSAKGEIVMEQLEHIVRSAHIFHGHVMEGRDHVRRLNTNGITVSRPSRL